MALVLNEEQNYLKDTAREFFKQNAPIEALRKLRDERDTQGWSKELWQQMVELGWSGIVMPEAYGGLEFGYLGLGAIVEESGRTLSASPLLASVVLAGSCIELAGNDEQKTSHLTALIEGRKTFALAVDEGPHHQPLQTALTATQSGDQWTLNGNKSFVIDGASADSLVVVARTSGEPGDAEGISLFLVDAESAGLKRERLIMSDSRHYADLNFDSVQVGNDALLGEAGAGLQILDKALDRGRIVLAAEMLGSMREAFERTVEYLKEREQFGAKIGSFQALQHRAADMYCDIQLTQSVVLDALSAIDENRPDLARSASLAKARCNDVFHHIAGEAVQMHGGIGVTDELEIGFFLKRSRMATQLLGNSGFHRDRYASACGY